VAGAGATRPVPIALYYDCVARNPRHMPSPVERCRLTLSNPRECAWTKHLKVKAERLLSNSVFSLNLRRYTPELYASLGEVVGQWGGGFTHGKGGGGYHIIPALSQRNSSPHWVAPITTQTQGLLRSQLVVSQRTTHTYSFIPPLHPMYTPVIPPFHSICTPYIAPLYPLYTPYIPPPEHLYTEALGDGVFARFKNPAAPEVGRCSLTL